MCRIGHFKCHFSLLPLVSQYIRYGGTLTSVTSRSLGTAVSNGLCVRRQPKSRYCGCQNADKIYAKLTETVDIVPAEPTCLIVCLLRPVLRDLRWCGIIVTLLMGLGISQILIYHWVDKVSGVLSHFAILPSVTQFLCRFICINS